jgi:succinoglycan biosynthesis transport protein ExoP
MLTRGDGPDQERRLMAAQGRDTTWRVLLRSRWLILAIVVTVTATTAVLSKLQPPVYRATALLVVDQPDAEGQVGRGVFDVVQANQAFARTLVHIIDSRNVADIVSQRLPFQLTPNQIRKKMDFAPVNETQLIEVTAEDGDARRAALLANTYAEVFVSYVKRVLPNASPSSGLSVADRAVTPRSPARPKPMLYTLVALLLSTAGAVALALIRHRLDDRLHDTDALAEEFGLPVLGELPRVDLNERSERRFEEAVRLLCTTMTHATPGTLRSVVITSSREGEGKSTVAAEVAEALAAMSLVPGAVLAVDADLRRPTLHERLGLGTPTETMRARGLASYLRGQSSFHTSVVTTPYESLRLMPSGPLPTHASTLLGLTGSREQLRRLKDEAEMVVFDTPPLSVAADASILAAEADGVLLVVDLSKTKAGDIRASLDQLLKVGCRPLGFVVNRSRRKGLTDSYYYVTPPAETGKPAVERSAAGS